MNSPQLLRCRDWSGQEFRAREIADGIEYSGQALDPFRMAWARIVTQTIIMMDDQRFHGLNAQPARADAATFSRQ